jgi:RNA polymerase-binding transcription factor DksA
MTPERLAQYRRALLELGRRVRITSEHLEEASRTPTSGESAGGLSNVPMHLADVASEAYAQELNATLRENEEVIRVEVIAALDRLDGGAFGVCEECRRSIPEPRLDVVPYARHCVGCAEKAQSAPNVNLNEGRPAGWGSTLEHPAALAGQRRAGEQSPTMAPRGKADRTGDTDRHAAGTPGGGTAIGGLGGTNLGTGDMGDADLEDAMATGTFDSGADADEASPGDGYAGHSGGAVGGTPAGKRVSGGRTHGGLSPGPGSGDSPTP